MLKTESASPGVVAAVTAVRGSTSTSVLPVGAMGPAGGSSGPAPARGAPRASCTSRPATMIARLSHMEALLLNNFVSALTPPSPPRTAYPGPAPTGRHSPRQLAPLFPVPRSSPPRQPVLRPLPASTVPARQFEPRSPTEHGLACRPNPWHECPPSRPAAPAPHAPPWGWRCRRKGPPLPLASAAVRTPPDRYILL